MDKCADWMGIFSSRRVGSGFFGNQSLALVQLHGYRMVIQD
jgi:hypothetical protein